MDSGALSPFWSIWGVILWIVILSLPIWIYLAIAEVQRARRKRDEPTFTLGERLDQAQGKQPERQPPQRPGKPEKRAG